MLARMSLYCSLIIAQSSATPCYPGPSESAAEIGCGDLANGLSKGGIVGAQNPRVHTYNLFTYKRFVHNVLCLNVVAYFQRSFNVVDG